MGIKMIPLLPEAAANCEGVSLAVLGCGKPEACSTWGRHGRLFPPLFS